MQTGRQTNWHDKADSLFLQLCKCALQLREIDEKINLMKAECEDAGWIWVVKNIVYW